VVFAVVAVGSSVQASVGFGLGLIAAPVLLLVDSQLVPGPLMASGIVLTVLVAYRERAAIDLVGLRFAFGGRVLGTVLAAAVLTSISQRVFDFVFASLVLVAVALALSGWSVAPNRGRAAVAGAVSGFMGTLSSIGGPPMALLYQGEGGARFRGTLSGYFVLGATFSVVALSVVGRFGGDEAVLTAYLVPAILVGLFASRWLREYVDRSGVRPFVLGLSFCSAMAVLVRALV